MSRTLKRAVIGVGGYQCSRKEKLYVQQVLDSNRISYGPWTRKFELMFAQLHGCKFAIFCNSGTSALQIALAALKEKNSWNDGDEVIVPATTFISTSNVIIYNKLKPVFVDVDPVTYNISPQAAERAVGPLTRAILPVHLFGQPCDMEPIMELARSWNLRVVEDSCETMFAKYRGRSVGSFGDIGCFSTYVAHILITGVGGLATTNDPELYVLLRSLINHGRDSIYLSIDDDDATNPGRLKEIIKNRFSFVRFGHSFRATEMEAALGCAQLEDYEDRIRIRQRNARVISAMLKPYVDYLQLPFTCPDRDHVFMMYPIVIKKDAPFSKEDLVYYLEVEENIETRDMLPLINQPIYEDIFVNQDDYPVSKWLVDNGFYIGCHPYLEEEDLERIGGAFKRAIGRSLVGK
jgi:dTDP-4-amino-4,6-dideoxygalactose transaminase